jgi:AraC-like DNA-binding protein
MKLFYILFFSFFSFINSFSQEKPFVIPDSLKNLSFEELEQRFENSPTGKDMLLYSNVYYKKSKKQEEKKIILNGLYMKGHLLYDKIRCLKYLDTIINLTKNNSDGDYPAKAYILKSDFYFGNDELHKALKNSLLAEKYISKTNNVEQNIKIKEQIASIKIELGKPKEALPLLIEYYDYYKQNNPKSIYYTYASFSLAEVYNRLNNPKKSLWYCNDMLKKIGPNNTYYKYFLLNKGVAYHLLKEYKKSNELLNNAISSIRLVNHRLDLAIAYYYLGENAFLCNEKSTTYQKYFTKVDSILLTTKEFTPLLRNNYVRLIEITKKQNNSKLQLYYMDRLIKIDAYLSKNNIVVSDQIVKNYDTPKLLSKKEKIIETINNKNTLYLILGSLFFIGLLLTSFYLYKTKKDKNIFEARYKALVKQPKLEPLSIENTKTKAIKTKPNDLPEEIAKPILEKLKEFEKNQQFLDKEMNQAQMAKDFETNTAYLSKTMNYYMDKNFSQYLNGLRIDYCINQLKEDKKFRKYNIKYIAEEVGFRNSESFAKAFLAKTGLQPSYFVKKLNDE